MKLFLLMINLSKEILKKKKVKNKLDRMNKHVIVCGHYNCGGVKAALTNQSFGLINKWLRNIKEVYKSSCKLTKELIPN